MRLAPILGRLALLTLCVPPAMAEPPMNVDDAGTLARGGMKLEGNLTRDHKTRGGDLTFGFAPLDYLEVGLTAARALDRADSPATRLNGTGLVLKWVPIQAETGWSLGLVLGWDRTRVNERATPAKYTEREYALMGLASHRWEGGRWCT